MSSVPAKRKSLTIDQKVEIIRRVDNGETHTQAAESLNLPRTTVTNIIKKKVKILEQCRSINSKLKKARPSNFPKTDAALLKWLDVQRELYIPINGPLLLAKAVEFAVSLGETGFKGSNGWLELWKKRHNISFQAVSGEAGAVNDDVVNNLLSNIWPSESEGYLPKDIFNCDETGLFFKLLPNKTFARKGKTCTGGKLSKERVTVLLCANADGSEKLKPVVIGKYENPRCFKSVKKTSLPTYYYWNSSAWMTKDIFSDWLKKLDLQMRFKKRKILLLLDNCAPHKVDTKLNNIKLLFFPPNVTSKLQPCDQGIINEAKNVYRSVLVKKIIDSLDNKSSYQIDILESIVNFSLAWKKVPAQTIKSCFVHSRLIPREEVNVEDGPEDITGDITDEQMNLISMNRTDFQEYVATDSHVLAYGLPTEGQILEEVNPSINSVSSDESDGEDDPEIERPIISASQALKHLDDLKLWAMNRDDEDSSVFNSLLTIQNVVETSRFKSLKQSSMLDFVVVKD